MSDEKVSYFCDGMIGLKLCLVQFWVWVICIMDVVYK